MSWITINKNDCKNATFLIEKNHHTKLRFVEHIKLQMHLYGCSWCKTYKQQSKNMELIIDKLFEQHVVKTKVLQEKFKDELRTLISNQLKQQ